MRATTAITSLMLDSGERSVRADIYILNRNRVSSQGGGKYSRFNSDCGPSALQPQPDGVGSLFRPTSFPLENAYAEKVPKKTPAPFAPSSCPRSHEMRRRKALYRATVAVISLSRWHCTQLVRSGCEQRISGRAACELWQALQFSRMNLPCGITGGAP